MIQMILLNLLFFFNSLFIFMKHPLSMSMILVSQTIIISFISGMMNKNFWFSYILFLIFIGAMLILFIYITSLSSNELFNFSYMMILFPMILTVIFLMSFKFSWNFNNADMINYMNNYNNNNFNNSSFFMLFNFPLNSIIIMMMIYLLMTLIVIIKITKFFKGPLRMMN
nr:NADH dehydrogenase subunit 6 [Dipseliopoda setosa]